MRYAVDAKHPRNRCLVILQAVTPPLCYHSVYQNTAPVRVETGAIQAELS